MQFSADPAINSFVRIKRQNEPLWLKVIAVVPGRNQLTGQIQATPIALSAEIGDLLIVNYDEVVDTAPAAAPPVNAQASVPKKPSGGEKQRMSSW
jgi:hypothetical protein